MFWGLLSTDSERREEFARYLGSPEAVDVVTRHFISFLETERREEFARFLKSEKALDAVKNQFVSFLRANDGKKLLIDLLIEALARRDLSPILKSAETRLKELAAERVESLQTEAETVLEISAASHSAALKREANKVVEELADQIKQDVRNYLSSYQAKVLEAATEQLLFRDDIARHARSGHTSLARSNRDIAREHGISIREVKRRRRAALGLPDESVTRRRRSKRYSYNQAHSRRREEIEADAILDLAFNPAFLQKIDDLLLSARSGNCLKNDNIVYIGDLVQKSEAEMLRIPNFGPTSLSEIKEVLAQMGFHLGMEVPGWPPDNIDELVKRFENYNY